MKFGEINYRPQSGVSGQIDITQPRRLHQAKAQSLAALGALGTQIAQQATERQEASAQAAYKEGVSQVNNILEEKEMLTREELLELGVDESNVNVKWNDEDGNPVEHFKTYEVQTQVMQANMDRLGKEASKVIQMPRAKREFQSAARESQIGIIDASVRDSARKAKDFEWKSAQAQAAQLTDPAAMRAMADSPEFKANPVHQEKLRYRAKETEYEQSVNDLVNNGNVEALQAALEGMQSREFREGTGLDETFLQQKTNQVRLKLSALTGGTNDNKGIIRQAGDDLIASLDSGRVEDPESVKKTIDYLVGIEDFARAADVERAYKGQQYRFTGSKQERNALMAEAMGSDRGEILARYQSEEAKIETMLRNEPWKLYEQVTGAQPNQLFDDNNQPIPGAMGDRRASRDAFAQAQNVHPSSVPALTTRELDEITKGYQDWTDKQKMDMSRMMLKDPASRRLLEGKGMTTFVGISSYLDDDAGNAVRQVAILGDGAPDNMFRWDTDVMKDKEWEANSKQVLSAEENEIYTSTAKSIYKGMMLQNKGSDDESPDFDEKMYKRALETAVGVAVTAYGRPTFIPHGLNANIFEEWTTSPQLAAQVGKLNANWGKMLLEGEEGLELKPTGSGNFSLRYRGMVLPGNPIFTYDRETEYEVKGARQKVGNSYPKMDLGGLQ